VFPVLASALVFSLLRNLSAPVKMIVEGYGQDPFILNDSGFRCALLMVIN
jgi:hypothetical protein